jgi:MULE transposase domain
MNQFDQFDNSVPFGLSEPLISPTPSPPPSPPRLAGNASDAPAMLSLPPLATYPSREALFEAIQAWAKLRGYAFSIARSKQTESGHSKVYYACDRRAQNQSNIAQNNRLRTTQSRGLGCLFSIIGAQTPNSSWEVRHRPGAQFNTHNHLPSESPAAHSSHRHLSIEAQNTAKQLHLAGIQPRNTLTLMRQMAPETPLIPRDLYNLNASFRRDIRQGQSPTEALLEHLESSGIKHNILKDPANQRLKGLFIACPESITYLQSHHDVVLIDNTYSTNRFDMPLMDIIGVDHNSISFFIAFAFLPDQSEGSYRWALANLKDLFNLLHPLVGISPGAVSTDCDQALRNAISSIFPESATLLCLWHANKNVQQHCKGKFTSNDAYADFFQAWQSIVRSATIPEYEAQLLQFSTKYSTTLEHQVCI